MVICLLDVYTARTNIAIYKVAPKFLFVPRFKDNRHLEKKITYYFNNTQHIINIEPSINLIKGNKRYVADGFLDKKECDLLIEMSKIAVIEGDGYPNNTSPHSMYEKFKGASLGRLTLLLYLGFINFQTVDLFFHVTDAIQNHIIKHFNISDPLYFTFSHLVERSSIHDSPTERRQDFSHKIHADNCILLKNECIRKSPAYTWRDYSAILYLNDNFIGGEFIFTNDLFAKKINESITPHCGRMIAFAADGSNPHGVRAINKGSRFAIALWFTFQNKYLETDRILARAVLKRVQKYGYIKLKKMKFVPVKHEEILDYIIKKDKYLQEFLPL